MQFGKLKYASVLAAILMSVASCSVYKHVPEGSYLLHGITVESDDADFENASKYKAMSYQTPNSRWLGLFRIPLRIYSLSSRDRDGNEGIFRRLGEEPVILDTALCRYSVENIARSLANEGFLKASVTNGIRYSDRPKAEVTYRISPGTRYVVSDYETIIPDTAIAGLLQRHDKVSPSLITAGMPLDATVLDAERDRIVSFLKTRGYYSFSKDNISFVADTTEGSASVRLQMSVRPYTERGGEAGAYPVYRIGSVSYVFTDGSVPSFRIPDNYDSLSVDGCTFYFVDNGRGKMPLKPSVVRSHSYLRTGALANSNMVSRTYTSMGRLNAVKYTNIRFRENPADGTLDAQMLITGNTKYSFSTQIEGTNTAGDLGAAASVAFTDRNLFGGGERLTVTLRGAFEAITELPGYTGNSYVEYGAEANLDFPELLLPFVKPDFQRRSQATSQLRVMLNSQRRPEFNKTVFSFGWSYLWSVRRHSHRIDVFDVDYKIVPWISDKFREEYLDPIGSRNSILRYNYEDMLLTKLGYSYYYSNASVTSSRPVSVSVSINAETSGNLLYGISKLAGTEKNEFGQYRVLGISFAQYAKTDGAFTLNWQIDKWNNLVFHTEFGLAYPYSNSGTVPFEKRYYAGGANSVRGWAVRELGPGCYRPSGNAVNYITQAGDVKLAASIEFRAHLFWKLNAALFADAGNIWTIREYDEQPGGVFAFDKFYRQIGVSYGYGLRMDLKFLVLRLDFGRQLVNPAYESGPERYPAYRSVGYRNYALHFAIGYPF